MPDQFEPRLCRGSRSVGAPFEERQAIGRGGGCVSAGTGEWRRIFQPAAGITECYFDSSYRWQHGGGAAEYWPVRFGSNDRLFQERGFFVECGSAAVLSWLRSGVR